MDGVLFAKRADAAVLVMLVFDKRCRMHLACLHLGPFLRMSVFSTSHPGRCYTIVDHVNRKKGRVCEPELYQHSAHLMYHVRFKCAFVPEGQCWFCVGLRLSSLCPTLFKVTVHLASQRIPISVYYLSIYFLLMSFLFAIKMV